MWSARRWTLSNCHMYPDRHLPHGASIMHSNKSKTKPKASHATQPITYHFEAIGTTWVIDIGDSLGVDDSAQLLLAIKQRIEVFDKTYSRFRADSLVTQMAAKVGRYVLPPDAEPLMELYAKLYELTDGAMTPLIGRALSDAGYDADYSLQPRTVHTPPVWQEAIEYQAPELTVKQPVLLDFGAAGKGYLVDIIASLLREHGIQSYSVNAGGDIAHQTTGNELLQVGLEHPGDASLAIGLASIHNQSLCGSAGNRRAWAQYHHIMDPHSLESPRHIMAVWVVADSTLLSDALTTALYFAPPGKLAVHFQFEYAIVADDYSLHHSPNFPATFFTNSTKG